ncbi:MAG: methyltransferase family protein [Deltaproteobacteria bacterium]
MKNFLFENSIKVDYLGLAINVIVGLCVAVLFISILINFVESNNNGKVQKEKKSIVATGTMTLFFLFFYFLIRLRIGAFNINSMPIKIILLSAGVFLVVLGCIVNVKGRFSLGKNWANHIKIYETQTLVIKGPYRIVRHPLYASIIWMFYGASFIYENYAAFFANTLIFIPFMYYRAKQEEEQLSKIFEYYNKYKSETGMFFPKIIRRCQDEGM